MLSVIDLSWCCRVLSSGIERNWKLVGGWTLKGNFNIWTKLAASQGPMKGPMAETWRFCSAPHSQPHAQQVTSKWVAKTKTPNCLRTTKVIFPMCTCACVCVCVLYYSGRQARKPKRHVRKLVTKLVFPNVEVGLSFPDSICFLAVLKGHQKHNHHFGGVP